MQRIISQTLIVLLTFLLATLAQAGDEPRSPLQAAYVEFPPLTYTTEDGDPAGSLIKLTEQLATEAGMDIQWQELPLGRIYLYLKNGTIDLWPGTARIQELEPHVLEASFHPVHVRLSAFHMPGTQPVSEISDLKGQQLILVRGYTYWGLLEPVVEHPDTYSAYAPNPTIGLNMLDLGRGSYLLDFDMIINKTLLDRPLPGLQRSPLRDWPVTLVVSKEAPGAEKILKRLNESHETLGEDVVRLDH